MSGNDPDNISENNSCARRLTRHTAAPTKNIPMKKTPLSACLFALAIIGATPLHAELLLNPGFTTNILPGNDDYSTGAVAIGFTANFFGSSYSQLYVNNNGNVTFGTASGTFTPTGLGGVTIPIIAPFFADVDTRSIGSSVVTYGVSTVGGRSAFGVNWDGVGYFSGGVDKLNQFQLVLIDRSDVSAGDFDVQFNYGNILWETGTASGGTNGYGGASAAVGYSNGVQVKHATTSKSRVLWCLDPLFLAGRVI